MLSPQTLRRLITEEYRSLIKEEQIQYVVYLALKSEPDAKIGGFVEDQIRAVPSVTIVDTKKDIRTDYFGNKTHYLKVKFLSGEGLTKTYMKYLKNRLLSIKDKEGDRIIAVKVTIAPKVDREYSSEEEK
jgi:hypothetical protein